MKKILCPGEALIDFVGIEAKPLVECTSFEKKAGGAPANAAGAMSKLGCDSYFIGSVGNDPFGKFLLSQMEKYNINTSLVTMSDKFTTLAYVSIDDNGERDFIFNRGADEDLVLGDMEFVTNFDCIHFASATAFLGGQLMDSYYKLLEAARKENKLITFDANYRDALFSDKVDIFKEHCNIFISNSNIVKLSEEEAMLLTGKQSMIDAGSEIVKLGCDYLLITLGSEGTLVFDNANVRQVPSEYVKAVDTTGAGDAFIGTVIAKSVQKPNLNFDSMCEIVKFANKIGALTTQKFGALEAIPSIEEVL